jgi:hypothetical protein
LADYNNTGLDGHNLLPKVIEGVTFTDGIEAVSRDARVVAARPASSPKFGACAPPFARTVDAGELAGNGEVIVLPCSVEESRGNDCESDGVEVGPDDMWHVLHRLRRLGAG